jgi:hypothetical protein
MFTFNRAEGIMGRRQVDRDSIEYNRALLAIVDGKFPDGGVTIPLSTITGLSMEALRDRAGCAAKGYPPEPLPVGTGLDDDDRARIGVRFARRDDPEFRDWVQGTSGTPRKDPDREDARVRRERVTQADGSSRLISIAIDPDRRHPPHHGDLLGHETQA